MWFKTLIRRAILRCAKGPGTLCRGEAVQMYSGTGPSWGVSGCGSSDPDSALGADGVRSGHSELSVVGGRWSVVTWPVLSVVDHVGLVLPVRPRGVRGDHEAGTSHPWHRRHEMFGTVRGLAGPS